jgi:hypothetical protein
VVGASRKVFKLLGMCRSGSAGELDVAAEVEFDDADQCGDVFEPVGDAVRSLILVLVDSTRPLDMRQVKVSTISSR